MVGARTSIILSGTVVVVVALMVLSLVLSFSGEIVTKLQDTQLVTGSNTIINESITPTINGITQLNQILIDNVTVTVHNVTISGSGGLLLQTSWNMNSTQGLAGQINISNSSYVGGILNVTYTYQTVDHSVAFNASGDGLSGLTSFSSFQPTFAVIAIAVIVIGLLLGGFAAIGLRK